MAKIAVTHPFTAWAKFLIAVSFDVEYRKNERAPSPPLAVSKRRFPLSVNCYLCEFSSILVVFELNDLKISKKCQLRTLSTAWAKVQVAVMFDGEYRENERAPSSAPGAPEWGFLFSFICYSCKFSSIVVVVEIKKLEKAKNPNINVHIFFLNGS